MAVKNEGLPDLERYLEERSRLMFAMAVMPDRGLRSVLKNYLVLQRFSGTGIYFCKLEVSFPIQLNISLYGF